MFSSTKQQSQTSDLKQAWREWIAIVQLFADRQTGRQKIQSEQYVAVHSRLTKAIDRVIEEFTDQGIDTVHLQDLLTLIQPWNHLNALQTAEHRIAQNLCQQAKEHAKAFEPTQSESQLSWWVAILCSVLAFFVFYAVLDPETVSQWDKQLFGPTGLLGTLTTLWKEFENNRGNAQFLTILGGFAAMIVVMVVVVFRRPRNY